MCGGVPLRGGTSPSKSEYAPPVCSALTLYGINRVPSTYTARPSSGRRWVLPCSIVSTIFPSSISPARALCHGGGFDLDEHLGVGQARYPEQRARRPATGLRQAAGHGTVRLEEAVHVGGVDVQAHHV